MNISKTGLLILALLTASASGCAYRTSSNIKPQPEGTVVSTHPVIIAEDDLPGRRYEDLGPIEVSVKKLTMFHADPTREQANEALIEQARVVGADAVINVTYKSGIGLMTWGYMDAKGSGVKFVE